MVQQRNVGICLKKRLAVAMGLALIFVQWILSWKAIPHWRTIIAPILLIILFRLYCPRATEIVNSLKRAHYGRRK